MYTTCTFKASLEKLSGQSAKQPTIMGWHAVCSDPKIPNSDKLFVPWNGDKFVIPVTPTPVAELNTNLKTLKKTLMR